MNVNGREINFRRTVYTDRMLMSLSPNHDPNHFGDLFQSGDITEQYDAAATLICAMSTGHENWKKFSEPGYVPNPITFDEAMSLDVDVFMDLFQAAISNYTADSKETVKTVPRKGQKKTGVKSS